MNQGQWVRSMASTMSAHVNMGEALPGRCLCSCLIISRWLRWLRGSSSACMEGFLLVLIVWTILGHWRGYRKYRSRGQCAICFGRIRIAGKVGGWIREEWPIPSEKILLSSLTTPMAWRWSVEHTSWWWAYLFPHSGLLNHPQKQRDHHLLRPELLLPMRQPRSHNGCRLAPEARLHNLRPSPKQVRRSSKEACAWLFPLIPSINNPYSPCFSCDVSRVIIISSECTILTHQ